jgi:hypothetical protein
MFTAVPSTHKVAIERISKIQPIQEFQHSQSSLDSINKPQSLKELVKRILHKEGFRSK